MSSPPPSGRGIAAVSSAAPAGRRVCSLRLLTPQSFVFYTLARTVVVHIQMSGCLGACWRRVRTESSSFPLSQVVASVPVGPRFDPRLFHRLSSVISANVRSFPAMSRYVLNLFNTSSTLFLPPSQPGRDQAALCLLRLSLKLPDFLGSRQIGTCMCGPLCHAHCRGHTIK